MTEIVAILEIIILLTCAVYVIFRVAKAIARKEPQDPEKETLCDTSVIENAVAQALTFDKLLHGSDEKIDESVDKRSEVQDSIVSIRYNMIGRRYRHFKGSIYIIDGIAVHSETAEPLVIYHEEHERNRMWARPLSMFLSPVDKKKYPDATQEMRFEKIYGE